MGLIDPETESHNCSSGSRFEFGSHLQTTGRVKDCRRKGTPDRGKGKNLLSVWGLTDPFRTILIRVMEESERHMVKLVC